MALTAIAWSGNSITARFVNDIVPPIGLSFWRWAAAAPILIIMSWPHLRRDLPMLKQNWLIMLTLSVLAISMYSTLIYQALLTTTAINSFLINASRPTIIVLLSILFFRQGITFVQSIGFVVALLGTFTIILRGEPSHLLTLEFNTGDLWVLAATTVWALYTV